MSLAPAAITVLLLVFVFASFVGDDEPEATSTSVPVFDPAMPDGRALPPPAATPPEPSAPTSAPSESIAAPPSAPPVSIAPPPSAPPEPPASHPPARPGDVGRGTYPSRGGGESAPVVLVEFSDFQCSYCKKLQPTLDQVVEQYGDRVAVYFRDYPIASLHKTSPGLHAAARCASEQGAFWPMHDRLFADPERMVDHPEDVVRELGLDLERLRRCLADPGAAGAVVADLAAGEALGVTGTPTLFLNGRELRGAQPFAKIAAAIDGELERVGAGLDR